MSKTYYEENFKKQLVNIYNQGNHTYRELHEQCGSITLCIFSIDV